MTTALPADLRRRIQAVAADHRSGASRLGRLAVDILLDAHAAGREVVPAVACALCRAQPAMALVWNAASRALGPDGVDALRRMGQRLDRAPAAIGRVCAGLVAMRRVGDRGRPVTIATVSASGSVRSCLEVLAREGPLRVVCAEGRPLYEGRRLARALAAVGAEVTVCTDAAVGAVMTDGPGVDVALVGADAVTPRSVLNKCGTRLLAETAAGAGTPVYVAAARDAFVGPLVAGRLSPGAGPAREVWRKPPPGVRVANPYFEWVSVELVSAFVTDAGAVGAGSVAEVSADPSSHAGVEHLIKRLYELIILRFTDLISVRLLGYSSDWSGEGKLASTPAAPPVSGPGGR